MERPAHLMIRNHLYLPRRFVALSGALLLVAAAVYWIATGLVVSSIHFIPHTVVVDFFKTERPEPKPVPLPQLKFVPPPIPVVDPPEIQIEIPKPPPRIRAVKARPHRIVIAAAPVQRAAPPAPPPAPPKPRGITAPVSIGAPHSCENKYPLMAVRLNQQGNTTVWFMVNTDGSVSNVQIAKSSGHEVLDQAAVSCASAWRYRPALQDGHPVARSWSTIVQWRLRNGLPA